MANHPIVDILNTKFSGKISRGAHNADSGSACILEVVACARGLEHTDSPERVGMPDIRAINDAFTDDDARSLAMVRLGVALWDWSQWSEKRRIRFARELALQTIKQVLPPVLDAIGLGEHAKACREANEIDAAYAADDAAYAADDAYADDAANAADAAARSADAAYDAANAADAAARSAAYASADAANAAYDAARYAADAVASAAASAAATRAGMAWTATLNQAVDIWIQCANESKS